MLRIFADGIFIKFENGIASMLTLFQCILILFDGKSTFRMYGNQIFIDIVKDKCEIGYWTITDILFRI